jgi:hypothetical protein
MTSMRGAIAIGCVVLACATAWIDVAPAHADNPGMKPKAELDAEIKTSTRRHRRAASFRLDLAKPEARRLKIKRGTCYVVVARLEAEAAWSIDVVEHGVMITLEGADEGVSAGPGLIGPGAVAAFGCMRFTAPYELLFQPLGGPHDETRLGAGHAAVEIFTRPARRGELAALERELREQEEESRRSAEERKREHCRKCREESDTKDELETCARTGGYSSGDCY